MRKPKLNWNVLSVTYEIVIPEDDYSMMWKHDSLLEYEDTIGAKITEKYKLNEVDYNPCFGNVVFFTASSQINTIALREEVIFEIEDYIRNIRINNV